MIRSQTLGILILMYHPVLTVGPRNSIYIRTLAWLDDDGNSTHNVYNTYMKYYQSRPVDAPLAEYYLADGDSRHTFNGSKDTVNVTIAQACLEQYN
jgi:hypothetical protein